MKLSRWYINPVARYKGGQTITKRRVSVCVLVLVSMGSFVLVGSLSSAGATTNAKPRQAGTWTSVGAQVDGTAFNASSNLRGRVSAVAVIPGSPPTEIIGTLGGIWMEQLGASQWTNVTNPSWPSTAVNSIADDPNNPEVLYAGTGYDEIDDSTGQPGDGILKSTDGGTTWTPLVSSQALMGGSAVTGLAIEPANDQIVVASANNGLFRTTDGGATWTQVLTVVDPSEVRLALDPVTGNLLAGVAQSSGINANSQGGTITTGHAIYKSTDDGQTWTPYAVDPSTDPGQIIQPAIITQSGITYAYALDIVNGNSGSPNGIYTSSDGGQTWTFETADNISPKSSIGHLVADPQNPATAYFAQASGPFEYQWGSTTSSPLLSGDGSSPQFGDFRTMAIGPGPSGGEALYSGHDGGTTYFDFASNSFVNNDSGLVSGIDYKCYAQSATSEISGAQDLGVDAYSGGSTSKIAYWADAYGTLIDQLNPSNWYAGVLGSDGNSTYMVSHDAGSTWNPVPLSPPVTAAEGLDIVQATGDPNVIILADKSGTIYVSTDDGNTWTSRAIPGLAPDYIRSLSAALIQGESEPVIYAGTGFGNLWRSGDLGSTWTSVGTPSNLSVKDIVIVPSASSGPTSEEIYIAQGVYGTRGYATYFAPFGDVEVSKNSGTSWTDIGSNFSSNSVNALVVNGSDVLAGTDHGVDYYTGSGWQPYGSGFPNSPVEDLCLSNDGKELFAATYGRGTLAIPYTGTSSGTTTTSSASSTTGASTTSSPTVPSSTVPSSTVPGSSTTSTIPGSSTSTTQAVSPTRPTTPGYWMLASDGTVYPFGSAQTFSTQPNNFAISIAPTPDGGGYEVLNQFGRVTPSGDAFAATNGSTTLAPNGNAISISVTADNKGYWIATSGGKIFSEGDAVDYGSPSQSGLNLASGIVDMVATPDGRGYWMLGGDGGVFTYGDAQFYGSTGAIHLNEPAVAMAPTTDGRGYWFVASDGGVFAFGDATFQGSMGGTTLAMPVDGIVTTGDGLGYWMVAQDGGVFAFGDATFVGSLGGTSINSPIVSIAPD